MVTKVAAGSYVTGMEIGLLHLTVQGVGLEGRFPRYLPWPDFSRKYHPPGSPEINICGLLYIGDSYSETLLVRFHSKILTYEISPYRYYDTPLRLEILIEVKEEGNLSGAGVKIIHWDWSQQDSLCGKVHIAKGDLKPHWLMRPTDVELFDYSNRVISGFIEAYRNKIRAKEPWGKVFNLFDTSLDISNKDYSPETDSRAWQQIWFVLDEKIGDYYAISQVEELLDRDEKVLGYRACLSSPRDLHEILGTLLWIQGEVVKFWPLGTYPGIHEPASAEATPQHLRNLVLL